MLRLCLFLLVVALPGWAAEPALSPEAFESHTTGKTLSYASPSGPFGAEHYPDRRVRWSYLDGECLEGRWYPEGQQICFVYDGLSSPQCWSFYLRNGRLMAMFENDPASTTLYETAEMSEPLMCLGPKIGA